MLDVIVDGVFWLFLTLDSFVYTFIDWIYRIILVLAEVDFFENSAILDRFIQRIYVILGVVMLFLVAYNLLRNIVNPDEAVKGKNSASKVVINIIVSVVLVGVVPMIFTFAQQFQTAILQQGTLSAIILGTDGVVSDENTIEYGGFTMAKGVLQAFFHPTIDYCQDGQTAADGCEEAILQTGVSYTEVWDSMQQSHSFSLLPSFNDDVHGDNQVVDYTFLISTVAGVFVIFVLLRYCVDVAIRTVKLAFYQIIAPITILARIIPGEQGNKVFNNWVKASISTYLEIFIRLAILFFAVLVITILNERKTDIFNTFGSGVGVPLALVAFCFLILGIVYFMKQAPEIIKDLTGLDGGKYGKSLMQGFGMMTAAFGGGATAAVRSFANDKGEPHRVRRALTAGLSGAGRGVWQGRKVGKPGDIPKAAGQASANALASRRRKENAGGFIPYMGVKFDTAKDKAKNWFSSEDNSRIQEFAGNLDKDVSQAQGVYKKTQDYQDAKALHTRLKNELQSYEEAWNKIKEDAQKDARTQDPSREDYISVEDLAEQNFVKSYGKSIDAFRTEEKAAGANVDAIKRNESKKKASLVASATRDFAFQLKRFSDLGFDVENAIHEKVNDEKKAQELINAYNMYKNFEGEELSSKLMQDLASEDKNVADQALKYVDALDMAKNYALDLRSTAMFKESAYRAKVNDASGDKKK